MNPRLLILWMLVFILPACDSSEKERQLLKREQDLMVREQDIELRRQILERKEQELITRENALDKDSVTRIPDTVATLHPTLQGVYNVSMRCIQTNCPESAVGDSKNEKWEIGIDSNQVIAKAISDNKIIRLYKGNYIGSTIQLIAQSDSLTMLQAGNMVVRLQESKNNQLTGQREITRQDNCRIIYDPQLVKQDSENK